MNPTKVMRFSTATLIAATMVAPAMGQDNNVNGSGATLFGSNFLTNIFGSERLDIDNDGIVTDFGSGGFGADIFTGSYINLQYTGTGSGNGFQDLVNYGRKNNGPASTGGNTVPWTDTTTVDNWDSADPGARNGGTAVPSTSFTGVPTFDFAPVDVPSTWFVTDTNTGAFWANSPGAGAPTAGYGNNPQQSNVLGGSLSTALNGAAGQSNKLKSLTPDEKINDNPLDGQTTLNLNTAAPNAQTLFDNGIVWTPIAGIANYGAQVDSDQAGTEADGGIRKTTYQHGLVSGRTELGENLVFATRDSGSGTRNGFTNSMGVDPSWGSGENVGRKTSGDLNTSAFLGPNFTPGNKGGSSRMEETVRNHRLAVGYTGLADVGSSRAGDDSVSGNYQLLAIANDTEGDWDGESYVFPVLNKVGPNDDRTNTFNNVLFNGDTNTGFQVGANQTFVTEGNPFEGDIYINTTLQQLSWVDEDGEGTDWILHPETRLQDDDGTINTDIRMASPYASAWMRNLLVSLEDAENESSSDGQPGDVLANFYALTPAVEKLPNNGDTDRFITNPNFSQDLNDSLAANPANLPVDSIVDEYGPHSANSNRYGKYSRRVDLAAAPSGNASTDARRVSNAQRAALDGSIYDSDPAVGSVSLQYTDGSTGGSYIANDGTSLAEGANMTAGDLYADRNAVAGDFDGNGVRNSADVVAMINAYENSAPKAAADFANTAGNTISTRDNLAGSDPYASLELIGDFTGDGNFSLEDVAYGLDGLFNWGRNGNIVDRKANYTEADNASTSGNILGAGFDPSNTLSTYDAGDSRGDIAGSGFEAAGWAPNGADGIIDLTDVDYIYEQFVGLDLDGTDGVEWANLDEVAGKVLVDGERVDFSADMTGDGVINLADMQEIVVEILDTVYGDVDFSGSIEQADLNAVLNNWGATNSGYSGGDFNGSGLVEQGDLNIILNNWGSSAAPSFAGFESVVPEPGVAALALGLAGLAMRRRRSI
ncbi:MAG: hypothetical protein AAF916_10520 [Planctomycetota bacterium]